MEVDIKKKNTINYNFVNALLSTFFFNTEVFVYGVGVSFALRFC